MDVITNGCRCGAKHRNMRQCIRPHRCGGCRWGLVAVPVGGGGAWPGFEATRRAKLAARTARGRAAAHLHTKQPGPTARCDGVRNTSGATSDTETGRRPSAHRGGHPRGRVRRRPEQSRGQRGDGAIQAERPASSVARCTPLRPASCAAWVRHENPSARYTASGCADRDGSSE